MKFNTPFKWIEHPVKIALVGAGGSGSQMLSGLSKINYAIKHLGHQGLNVTVFDPDTVSATNVGRQNFYPADIGQNKATLLTHRANLFYGTNWVSVAENFDAKNHDFITFDIIICCVDKAQFRADLVKASESIYDAGMLLDMGNGSSDGQVIFGHLGKVSDGLRLPNVFDYYPELDGMKDDEEPSCSMEESLSKQDLFVNTGVVVPALNLLWSIFRHGGLNHQGAFVDMDTGGTQPILIMEG